MAELGPAIRLSSRLSRMHMSNASASLTWTIWSYSSGRKSFGQFELPQGADTRDVVPFIGMHPDHLYLGVLALEKTPRYR